MSQLLDGTALVTGAASGIGLATALAYARAGCQKIVLADIDERSVGKVAESLRSQWPDVETLAIAVDVSIPTSVDNMIERTIAKFGRLDYAANVAGITCQNRTDAADYSLVEYDRIQTVNTRGLLLCLQAEIKAMRAQSPQVTMPSCSPERGQRGSIINIASTTGFGAIGKIMPYVTSKHAVVGITRAAAIDHARDGIRVNAVCPGIVDTPMLAQRRQQSAGNVQKSMENNPEVTPMGRVAYPEEVADVCVFLSSSLSSFMQGTMTVVDGGRMAAF